jgi:phospholipid/cholesterol/gamma-HCH transport system substrate-binding protein
VNKRTEIVVGIVILLSAVLVVAGTFWLKGGALLTREELVLEARLREVGQLQTGNVVKLRGVPIGRVTGIRLETEGDGVIVTLNLQRDAPIPADPVVIAAPVSMFGDWHLELLPRSRFPQHSYAESPDPNVVPGYALPDMSRLTAVVDQIASNLASLSARVDIAFTEETAHNVRRAIENIQEVSSKLTGMVDSQQRVIEEVARNLEQTTDAVGDAAESLNRAFAQFEAAVADGELARIVDNIERTTARADSLSSQLLAVSGEFRATLENADDALRTFGSLAEELRASEGSLRLLMQDSTLYRDLVRTSLAVQALIEDFQANPRKYINLSIF